MTSAILLCLLRSISSPFIPFNANRDPSSRFFRL
uniref:Uncharacterized protein n=1 Tax=Rhizophora mucronata TaxID=61149 RepID=A0A2P2LKF1_RHIMU